MTRITAEDVAEILDVPRYAALVRSLERIRVSATHEVITTCECLSDYRDRDLTDPQCRYHNQLEINEALADHNKLLEEK